jgi:hypothetical protein
MFRDLPLLPVQFVVEPDMYRILKQTCISWLAVHHLLCTPCSFKMVGVCRKFPARTAMSLQTDEGFVEDQLNVSG